jgi:hypothetical protein
MKNRLFLVLALLLLGGCGPAISRSELGTVEFEIPKVAGAEKPYVMPQLPPLENDRPMR